MLICWLSLVILSHRLCAQSLMSLSRNATGLVMSRQRTSLVVVGAVLLSNYIGRFNNANNISEKAMKDYIGIKDKRITTLTLPNNQYYLVYDELIDSKQQHQSSHETYDNHRQSTESNSFSTARKDAVNRLVHELLVHLRAIGYR